MANTKPKHVNFAKGKGKHLTLSYKSIPRGKPEHEFSPSKTEQQILSMFPHAEIKVRGRSLDVRFDTDEQAEQAKPRIDSILHDIGVLRVGNKITII